MISTKWGSEFTSLVDDAIEKCDSYLKIDFNLDEGLSLERELKAKFSSHIVDFLDDLHRSDEFHDMQACGLGADVQRNMTDNIETLMYRLIAFRANNYSNTKEFPKSGNQFSIQTNLTANQTQTINISFEDAKHQIEEMSGLSDVETRDTLSKIDEIQVIANSGDSKKTRWQKLSPILKWVADKSVDVGIVLLPLLMKAGGQ